MKHKILNVSRRDFLKAGIGFTIAVALPGCTPDVDSLAEATIDHDLTFAPNAFIRIGSDDTITIVAKHLEMGQGTYTGLATLIAEELDADWAQIEVVAAPADAKQYNNLAWGPYQGTGGSSAMNNAFEQMREAGATARAMLIQAAAQTWEVPTNEVTVKKGVLKHGGKELVFSSVIALAMTLDIPKKVALKNPKDFKLIGQHVMRKDSLAKTTGQAVFTQDIQLEGMLVAVVAHPPTFGAVVRSVNDQAAKAVNGVIDVVKIPNGIAVVAEHFWAAKKGRDALKISWDESDSYQGSSAEIIASYKKLATNKGVVAIKNGDAIGQLKQGKRFAATYTFPFLAHAAMEPMNCVMQFHEGACEVWNGGQLHSIDQNALSKAFGIKPDAVKINTVYAGGSFGRRGNPNSDYILEAASIVKAMKTPKPIKLVWTREDDMRGGAYRPIYVHQLTASIDDAGMPIAWHHTIVGQSITTNTPFEGMMVNNGVDATSVEGAQNLPYNIANLQVDLHTTNESVGVPVQWWRSVGSTHNAYSTEVFIDQLARLAEQDPIAYRLALLKDNPRHAAVLRVAADKANAIPGDEQSRQGRGVAVHESFKTTVAQIVDVRVDQNNQIKIDRVICVVDCGIAINPDVVKAQMEGSIGYALTAALQGEITLEAGKVIQGNFDRYPVLRIADMPPIEIYIVPSANHPTGVGEPGVPPLAPALANAIFDATGQHITQLPIGDQLNATNNSDVSKAS